MADNNYKCLSDILTEEEIKQMSSYVRIKLESHLEGRQLSIDNMKNQLANSVANAEKKNFAVERELQNTKSKLNMAEDFADKLKNQLREAEEALQKSRHDYYETLQC
jgi:chromosome segregation ATPase